MVVVYNAGRWFWMEELQFMGGEECLLPVAVTQVHAGEDWDLSCIVDS